MNVSDVFLSINARDFDAQVAWWTTLLGRDPDRRPMPSCREWDIARVVLFQVLDSPDDARVTVSLRIEELASEIERLRRRGLDVPDPRRIEGFDSLRLSAFADPEGNTVNLLEGA